MIRMARFRGFALVFSMLIVSLFCIKVVSSLPNEINITILEERSYEKCEKPVLSPFNEIQSIENFGDQKDFWTVNLDTYEWYTVRATLLAVGEHCYIYMDNRTITTMGQVDAITRSEICRNEFDRVAYPKNVELMGDLDGTLGDVDGDPRVTVFLVQGVGSYYMYSNEFGGIHSNFREMVYVDSQMPLYRTIAVICHETNHLFLFNYDADEATFLVEGLAEFSQYYAGYLSNSSFMQYGMVLNTTWSSYFYSVNPSVSMFFFDDEYHSYSSYGSGFMFVFYLAEKYGIQIIKDLIPIDALDGPEAIEYVLGNHGYDIRFNEIFLDFITACTINELGIYGDLYGFLNTRYKIGTRFLMFEYPITRVDVKHRYYNIEITEFADIPNKYTVEIETPDYPRSLGVISIIHDDSGWNVTQLILTGDGSTVQLLCEGNNIDEAYLVTSLIKEGTPNAPRSWGESPFNLLDITVKEGHPLKTTNKTSLTFLSLLPILLVTVIITKKTMLERKREKKIT